MVKFKQLDKGCGSCIVRTLCGFVATYCRAVFMLGPQAVTCLIVVFGRFYLIL